MKESDLNINKIGHIFNIQRYSTHDGPGVRTTVFLKGCPLRCYWCQNPESQSINPVLLVQSDKCIKCGRCIDACPNAANKIIDNNLQVNRSLCQACGECTKPEVCLLSLRKIEGRSVTVEEIMNYVIRDYNLYVNTGGGITISGGAPEAQSQFSIELLKAANENIVHSCIETTGYAKWEKLKPIIELADFILFDLKCIDEKKHIEGTGKSNKLILDNAKNILKIKKDILFRTPLIPGFNDSFEDIETIARFIFNELKLSPTNYLELLPYNTLGEEKYKYMGLKEVRLNSQHQNKEYLESLNNIKNSIK